ncbi:MAG: ABC transporter substrate-binding protein [Planctomycetota bacterium]|nr:ABC transporter substrate-binding protein [Planctomycetota bacterium]
MALLGAVVYVFAAALRAEPAPPPQAPVVLSRGYPLTVEEPGGRKVVIAAQPERILPADSSTADILAALVEPRRMVAVPATADSFAGAREFFARHPEIPRFQQFQAETLLALKPDLVLAVVFRDNATVDQLEQRGVPVLKFEHFRDFAGIRGSFMAVGLAVGEGEKAQALAEDFDRRLAAVARAVAGRPRPRALFYSRYDQGFAVGTGESQDEVLRRAGARNAAAELNLVGHVRFTLEQMLTLKPDYIVVGGDRGLDSPQARIVLSEPILAELPAVKERRIAVVPDRYATSVSQYVVDAVEILARQLHSDAFPQSSIRNPQSAIGGPQAR